MQIKQFLLLVAFCLSFVAVSVAQHKRYTIKNGISLIGGLTQYDITTDNFTTKSGTGFIGGMVATVDIPHKWYTVSYGFQFSQNTLEITGRPSLTTITQAPIEYDIKMAQVSFLLHVKLVSDYLTLDVGPQLQYNSELELKEDGQKNFIIQGYDNLFAEDLSNISNFNANGVIGASAGIGNFKLRAAYSYGFTNILGKLNDQDFNLNNADRFEGNQSMLSFALMITF
ncbi:outer membrane beta-barrel protein [Psychroserpens burtonensis]|uniref:Outer membrane beta-barrel protein n=2 Tax=Psychroserpens burtonensis TaxID=49278 RepID=A0A5C7BHJ3_9FLAO|nr:outer membrane beta-barrel protein [Psychroserpens burtonensis]TXE19123.1 outer membrane beta-barrel protein [Psychroserpens burtonensis]